MKTVLVSLLCGYVMFCQAGSGNHSPADVVMDFFKKAQDGTLDEAYARAHVADLPDGEVLKEEVEMVNRNVKRALKGNKISVVGTTIAGDKATVVLGFGMVSGTGSKMRELKKNRDVSLVKVNGEWKILMGFAERVSERCVLNMKHLQTAAECWRTTQSDPNAVPKVSDLVGPEPDKYIRKNTLTCPKDNSAYVIGKGYGGEITVSCGSGDPKHVLPQ